MTWLLLALGFFLMLSGLLGQVYSLKTKRGVLPPGNPHLARADASYTLPRRPGALGIGHCPHHPSSWHCPSLAERALQSA